MLFRLITVFILLTITHLRPIESRFENSDEPKIVTINDPSKNPSRTDLTFRNGDSIRALVLENRICDPYSADPKSRHDCESLEDELSFRVYENTVYTSTRTTSTEFDYKATRFTVLDHLRGHFNYRSYLEIGTNNDDIFRYMNAPGLFEKVIGVDPVSGGNRRMTSDDFFRQNLDHFDLIFVDGLHEANQVYRDVMNSLRWLSPNGTIVMHDCNPRGPLARATFPMEPGIGEWNGDVWKAAVAFRMKMDIEIVVVDIDYGVGVLRRRQNRHPLPMDWQEFLGVNPISMLDYSHHSESREDLHRILSLQEFFYWLSEEYSLP